MTVEESQCLFDEYMAYTMWELGKFVLEIRKTHPAEAGVILQSLELELKAMTSHGREEEWSPVEVGRSSRGRSKLPKISTVAVFLVYCFLIKSAFFVAKSAFRFFAP
jgi:hypothetical protein